MDALIAAMLMLCSIANVSEVWGFIIMVSCTAHHAPTM